MTPAKAKPYTPEEDARITALYEKGLTPMQIAEIVGRHRNSVDARIRRLGVTRRYDQGIPRNHMRWDAIEIGILRDNRASPVETLMQLLPGRNEYGIRRKLFQLFGQRVDPVTERPFGVPYKTSSGAWAIRLGTGVVPYVPSLHGRP